MQSKRWIYLWWVLFVWAAFAVLASAQNEACVNLIMRGISGAGNTDEDLAVLKEIHGNATNLGHERYITNQIELKRFHDAGIKVRYWKWDKKRRYEGCVNGEWGKNWADDIVRMACHDIECIDIIPDEFNWAWFIWRRKDNEIKNKPPAKETEEARKAREASLEEWKKQTIFCTCADCTRLFKERYGMEPPATLTAELRPAGRSAVQIGSHDKRARCWMKFRYDCTTEWIKDIARRVKEANPKVKMSTCYSINPLFHYRRYEPSIAWDRVGYETDLDAAGTDPYLSGAEFMGNGDHYYVPETTVHLVGASPKTRSAAVTLCPGSIDRHRPPEDIEIYGSAISAVAHGAREIYYFAMHLLKVGKATQDEGFSEEDIMNSRRQVKQGFTIIEDIEPWVVGARKPKDIALIYSRASDDLYQLFNETEPPDFLIHRHGHAAYGYMAQKEVLRFLLRQNFMFDLYYLEQLRYDEIKDYAVLIVPFAFAVDAAKAGVLKQYVTGGGKLLVISEFGLIDELGDLHKKSPLLDLLGLKEQPKQETNSVLTIVADSPFLAGKALKSATGVISDLGLGDSAFLGGRALQDCFLVYSGLKLADGARFLATDDKGEGCGVVLNPVGKGEVIFLAGEFGLQLPDPSWCGGRCKQDKRGYQVKRDPPVYREWHYQLMKSVVDYLLGSRKTFQAKMMSGGRDQSQYRDVEAVLLEKAGGERVVVLINWEHWRNEIAMNIRNLPPGTYKLTQRDLEKTGPFGKGVYEAAALTNLTVSLPPAEVKVLYIEKR